MSIAIEGLIGVGKTTVLKELAFRGHSVEFEQVDHWTLLPKMYTTKDDTGASAVATRTLFEIQILCSLAARSKESRFHERSIQSALSIFMPLLIQDEDSKSLIHKIAALADHVPIRLYVYLDADVDLCLERIKQRQRDGESAVSREYLAQLRESHEQWLATVPHVRINVKPEDSPADLAEKILCFVGSSVV